MSIDLEKFEKPAVAILNHLASKFPVQQEIHFVDIFPDVDGTAEEQGEHTGAIALLMQEGYIFNSPKGSAAFALTAEGADLFKVSLKKSLKRKISPKPVSSDL